MSTTSVRRAATVALAIVLATTLALEKPARAQSLGDLAYSDYVIRVAPSAATILGFTTKGSMVVATAYGTVVELTSAAGAAVAGGVTAAGAASATVAAGAGVLVGWGAYEAGIWSWLGCEHVLNTGSAACEDPDAEPVEWVLTNDYSEGGYGVVSPGAAPPLDFEVVDFGYWTESGEPRSASLQRPASSDGAWANYIKCNGNWYHYSRSSSDGMMGDCTWRGGVEIIAAHLNDGSVTSPSLNSYWTQSDIDNDPSGFATAVEGWPQWQICAGCGGEGVKEDREIVVDIECTDIAGGTMDVITDTVTTGAYAPGTEPLVPGYECPPGYTLTKMDARRTVIGDDGTLDEAIFDYDAPPLAPTDTYADCYDGSCVLELHRLTGTSVGTCQDEDVVCAGWWDYTEAGTVDDGTFECRWGTHVMPLTDCEAFRNIDEEGATAPADAPAPVKAAPGTAANPSHVEDGCTPQWSWNPFTSLASGVGCALAWALVPSEATMTRTETVAQTLQGKPPFSYGADLATWFAGMGDVGSACLDFGMTMPPVHGMEQEHYAIVDSCSTHPVTDEIKSHRGLLSVAVWAAFILPFAWWAWRQYAPGAQGDA